MTVKHAKIKVWGEDNLVEVKIASLKPQIIKQVVKKWQTLIDTTAGICNVPSGLITQLKEEYLEVFLNNSNPDNPIKKDATFDLGFGHYCEKVIGSQKPLIVKNATEDSLWRNEDPDTKGQMISYLGVPINWPDGEVFGTVCLLDHKENSFHKNYIYLVKQLKQHIEADLGLIIANQNIS